jgi:HEAT repeat protein
LAVENEVDRQQSEWVQPYHFCRADPQPTYATTMKSTLRWAFVGALLFSFLATTARVSAASKTEDQLIAELASPNGKKVEKALLTLEKQYPTGTKALPEIKRLLTDSRENVRRKAARVLGVLHAEVSEADLKNISALLKSSNTGEVVDGLKSLRGLKAESTVRDILPLLHDKDLGVVRDACRTLAVLGNKDHIPQIEPLLKHANTKVRADAQDAIFKLKSKS